MPYQLRIFKPLAENNTFIIASNLTNIKVSEFMSLSGLYFD
jgi:hypothetical protein